MNSTYSLFFVLAAAFAGAGAVKAITAMRAGQPYRFGWWEGLLFRNKALTRNATQLKALLSVAVVVGCLLYLAEIRSPGLELAMGGLIIMVISDIAGSKTIPSDRDA